MDRSKITHDRKALRDRVSRFFTKELLPNKEFVELKTFAENYGDVAVFGGLIRDLALGFAYSFRSDIDVVVQGLDRAGVARLAEKYDGELNAFGGCRFSIGRWMFDVWPLEETWALKQMGADRIASDFPDLFATTFLNVDAAVYNFSHPSLDLSPRFVDGIKNLKLDVNFRKTPNSKGAAVKTLRMMASTDFSLAPRLAAFLGSAIEEHGIHELVEKDRLSPAVSKLDSDFVGSVAIALRSYLLGAQDKCFSFRSFQRELPLHH